MKTRLSGKSFYKKQLTLKYSTALLKILSSLHYAQNCEAFNTYY